MSVLDVRFAPPQGDHPDQDEEWCEVRLDDGTRRFRFHDYAAIFSVPGLYERIFHDLLDCRSPAVLADLLLPPASRPFRSSERAIPVEGERQPDGGPAAPDRALRVLDLGAGNGIVGQELRRAGGDRIAALHAVDLLPEAAAAAARDRPGVYDSYTVTDLTAPEPAARAALAAAAPDALVVCAALGFGDIPPEALRAALALVRRPGLLAFTIKEEFLGSGDGSGFADLVAELTAAGELVPLRRRRYVHRRTMHGDPLHYVATVAALPDRWTTGAAVDAAGSAGQSA